MNAVKYYRFQAGLSGMQLADLTEISYSVIKCHERENKRSYHPHTAKQLSKVLGQSLDTLFVLTETGWMDKSIEF